MMDDTVGGSGEVIAQHRNSPMLGEAPPGKTVASRRYVTCRGSRRHCGVRVAETPDDPADDLLGGARVASAGSREGTGAPARPGTLVEDVTSATRQDRTGRRGR